MSITDLVTELLVLWENNPACTPEELCRDYRHHPEHAVLLAAVEQAIRDIEAADSMLATPHEDDSGSRATPGPFPPKLPSTVPPSPMPSDTDLSPAATALGSRYRPQSFHARGGLGEVWRAEDEELHREVALKRIQERHLGNAESLRRFLREAEITAKLQHPGVVPVHGLGRDEDGRLCYAMRFIEGVTLDGALKRFHEADRQPGRDPGERSLALRELLNRFIAVCNTVAYAHSQGILHRDLKPSNIMLGDYGETLVVDWGMAKPFARTDVERSTGEAMLMPPATEDTPEEETQHGQALGTPAYMSPEQAAGRWDVVGPASDIFSLGATLYAILTGQPPYRGRSQDEVLHKARRGQFPPPRQVKPDVPRALEAICSKAMALKAEERYATARGLGADVEKWLADELVTAWLEPFTARVRRWMRRHRAVVGSTAAALVVALVASTAGLFVLGAAERRERGLRETAQVKEQEALNEKGKAVAAQKGAMDALLATTDEVMERLIGAKPALSSAEKAFLDNTLKRWQTFAAEQGETEVARAIRAQGLYNVARLRTELGQYQEPVVEYEEAIELYKKLIAEFPAVPRYCQKLGRCYTNLGNLLADSGKRSEAEAAYRQALTIQEQLVADYPAVADYSQDLARSHNNYGLLLAKLGKHKGAEAAYRQALGIYEKLADEIPTVPQIRGELATTHSNLGNLFIELGKRPEGLAAYHQSLAIREKLAADNPAEPTYRRDFAIGHFNLGGLLHGMGKRKEAEAAYRRALAIQENLVADYPAVPRYRQEWARSHNNLGALLRDLGRRMEAEAAYRQALAIQEKLATDFPGVPQYRDELARSHRFLGELLRDMGMRPEAEAAYRHALTIQQALAAESPSGRQYHAELGKCQCDFGHLVIDQKRPEQALGWFDKAIETLEGALQQVDTDVSAQQFLRYAHSGRARALDELQRHADAVADWGKAVELSPEPEQPGLRMNRAASRVRAGQVDAALKEAEELAKIPHPAILYDAACVFALAADRRDEPAGSLSKEDCAKRAVALLQQAIAKGWKDVEHVKKDDDLKALRGRDDFKKLVVELEAKIQKP